MVQGWQYWAERSGKVQEGNGSVAAVSESPHGWGVWPPVVKLSVLLACVCGDLRYGYGEALLVIPITLQDNVVVLLNVGHAVVRTDFCGCCCCLNEKQLTMLWALRCQGWWVIIIQSLHDWAMFLYLLF